MGADAWIAGRYELRHEIAPGGMGHVHEGLDHHLDRPVAVKLLLPKFSQDAEYRARFEREAKSAARMGTHSNVVTLHDFGSDRGRLYLVMDLVEGQPLSDCLRPLLPLEEVRRLALEIGAGLAHVHRKGVVHSDVKPGNVLLDRSTSPRTAKISDFGLAQPLDLSQRLTGSAMPCTPEYVAPERVKGGPPTVVADVYSFGCLLFECLTGRPPYQEANGILTANAHIAQPVPDVLAWRPDLPPAVGRVVERALAKEPSDRYARADELAAALAAALPEGVARTVPAAAPTGVLPPQGRGESPGVTRPERSYAAPRPALVDRGPVRAVLGVAALAVVLTVAAFGWDVMSTDGEETSASQESAVRSLECDPLAEEAPEYDAVECEGAPDGVDELQIRTYDDATAMRALFERPPYTTWPLRECSAFPGGAERAGSGHRSTWGGEQPLACFVNKNGDQRHAVVVWGIDDLAAVGVAIRHDGDSLALLEWWKQHRDEVVDERVMAPAPGA